jgi:RNA polymerase sigma factor (TIGR02999 family)
VVEPLVVLLEKAQTGDRFAQSAFYKLAFQRLHFIASALLRKERLGHTLQPTALVSELFLKLHRFELKVLNEDHFFRISARAMRQVLIDHGRAKRARTSPEGIQELLCVGGNSAVTPENSLAAKLVFEKLRAMDKRTAETVWLRSVEGLTVPELSRLQNREEWKVRADFEFGLKWMAHRLRPN